MKQIMKRLFGSFHPKPKRTAGDILGGRLARWEEARWDAFKDDVRSHLVEMPQMNLRGRDIVRIFDMELARLRKGRETYGVFSPQTDTRNLHVEAIEELLDAIFYLFAQREKTTSFIRKTTYTTLALYLCDIINTLEMLDRN